jgi:hypothetical protein
VLVAGIVIAALGGTTILKLNEGSRVAEREVRLLSDFHAQTYRMLAAVQEMRTEGPTTAAPLAATPATL